MTEKEKRKQEILNTFKFDTTEIENQIEEGKITNLKVGRKKIFLKSLKVVKDICAHLAGPALAFVFFWMGNITPFKIDEYDLHAKYQVERDSLDQYDMIKSYHSIDVERLIESYSKWRKVESNKFGDLYERDVVTGKYKSNELDAILESMDNNTFDINDFKIKSKKERLEQTTNPDNLSMGSDYYKITYFDEDLEDILHYVETTRENNISTITYLVLILLYLLLCNYMVNTYVGDDSHGYDGPFAKLKDDFLEIDNENQLVDIKALERKLELTDRNYRRLTRGNKDDK